MEKEILERDAAQRECSRLREEVRRLRQVRDFWGKRGLALAARVAALEGALRHTSQLQHFYPAPCSECDAARALLSPPAAATPAPAPSLTHCSVCGKRHWPFCDATPAPQTAEQGIPSGPHPLDESGG